MEGIVKMSCSSFNATMPIDESELMAQLLGPYPFSCEQEHDLSLGFWPDHVTSDPQYLSYWHQESNASGLYDPASELAYCTGESDIVVPAIDGGLEHMILDLMQGAMSAVPGDSFGYRACLNEETGSEGAGDSDVVNCSDRVIAPDQKPRHKRKYSMDEVTDSRPQKNSKISSHVQKRAKIPVSKKTHKSNANDEGAVNVQSSSSCCSDDDSNASQELKGGGGGGTSSGSKGPTALNLNGKARAGRGSATDPQSLYARKRRERINERLRVLQNLIPNGTKVDLSTMLEEAVQYVKFLQLQIKLLSSDDLWMYAPLAYNGMDIGLDLKISIPPPRQ